MRIAILALLISSSCFAVGQQADTVALSKAEQVEKERMAAQKAAEAKAETDKKEAKQKAAEKLDNKNPQPIKDEAQRHRLELLQTRALLDQQKLQTMDAIIKASLQQPMAQAQASAKAYNDALAETQKTHHAEGCPIKYDEKGDVVVSKNGNEVWDCPQAAVSKEKK